MFGLVVLAFARKGRKEVQNEKNHKHVLESGRPFDAHAPRLCGSSSMGIEMAWIVANWAGSPRETMLRCPGKSPSRHTLNLVLARGDGPGEIELTYCSSRTTHRNDEDLTSKPYSHLASADLRAKAPGAGHHRPTRMIPTRMWTRAHDGGGAFWRLEALNGDQKR